MHTMFSLFLNSLSKIHFQSLVLAKYLFPFVIHERWIQGLQTTQYPNDFFKIRLLTYIKEQEDTLFTEEETFLKIFFIIYF